MAEENDRKISIRDLPISERPRERLLANGPAALSTAELLAIILRSGAQNENVLQLSARLLAQFNGLNGIASATTAELGKVRGLGQAKITQIMATIEIGRRLIAIRPDERPVVDSAASAARLVMDMGNLQQEHVRVILLDSARHLIAMPTIYKGTLNTSVIRVAEIFREAVIRNSPALILVHNHPSGIAAPSPEDVEITRTAVAAGKLLDVTLVDHLIIGQQEWCSLRDMGLGFDA